MLPRSPLMHPPMILTPSWNSYPHTLRATSRVITLQARPLILLPTPLQISPPPQLSRPR
ncbi:hypothetical protein BGW80DRAFT_1318718, partial [Lactifluus volemus]